MFIRSYEKGVCVELENQFVANNLIYGSGNSFGSLVSPSSTFLSADEANSIGTDLPLLWELYRTWNWLYQQSLHGEAPRLIAEYSEYGLSSEEVEAQRLTSRAELEPQTCRVDYVTIGSQRRIAEVQWKSGGPGLVFGIQDIYSQTIAYEPQTEALGDLVRRFRETILRFVESDAEVAVNAVREKWLNGEYYLQKKYADTGLGYFPIDKRKLAGRMRRSGSNSFLLEGDRARRIRFLYGQGFTRSFPEEDLLYFARAAIHGNMWIEAPLNYIYREKWGLALPFLTEYAGLFKNELREILIPSAILTHSELDLRPIAPYVEHPLNQQLLAVKTLDDLVRLPISLRRSLIVKCGAGAGDYFSDGKGVFRLGGSRSSAKKVIDFVNTRICQRGEPWIIQPYIDQTYDIPIRLPSSADEVRSIRAHARFIIFGSRFGTYPPMAIGGLGNYSMNWKVSGSSPRIDERGNILGSTFNDIRVTRSLSR